LETETFYGIAIQESGASWTDGSFRPWPWTLNVNSSNNTDITPGPRRYATRKSAEKALDFFIKKGITNVDVGLMQINLKWHGEKVDNKLSLLDPQTNLLVAAQILRDVKDPNSKFQTVARYHSFNPKHGNGYAKKVLHYEKIINASIKK